MNAPRLSVANEIRAQVAAGMPRRRACQSGRAPFPVVVAGAIECEDPQ